LQEDEPAPVAFDTSDESDAVDEVQADEHVWVAETTESVEEEPFSPADEPAEVTLGASDESDDIDDLLVQDEAESAEAGEPVQEDEPELVDMDADEQDEHEEYRSEAA
jgi:hypothetical protein